MTEKIERTVSDELYRRFFWMFDRMEEEQRICAACPGLQECALGTKGWQTVVECRQNQEPVEIKKPCLWRQQESRPVSGPVIYSSMNEEMKTLNMNEVLKTSGQPEIFGQIMSLIQNKKGIYLSGHPGVGKTWMMSALFNFIQESCSTETTMAFINIHPFLQELKKSFSQPKKYERLVESVKKADILFVDDLGSEQITAWSRDQILFPILDYRMEHCLLTCFTSNCPMAKLVDIYSPGKQDGDIIAAERFAERIRALSVPVIMKGKSRRYEEE